jgi:hypothetical protein
VGIVIQKLPQATWRILVKKLPENIPAGLLYLLQLLQCKGIYEVKTKDLNKQTTTTNTFEEGNKSIASSNRKYYPSMAFSGRRIIAAPIKVRS